jgi:hypothetical protein
MPRSLTKKFLVAAVVLGTLFSSSAAFAATNGHSAATPKQRGMTVTGFNAAVAKAHGYKIVTYANGSQQSVPINPKSHLPKSPILYRDRGVRSDTNIDYNQVSGNCGISWIRVSQTGISKVAVVSGFKNAPLTAIDWSWTVSLNDENGSSEQVAGGLIFNNQASRIWSNLNQYGCTFDYVLSGVAELIDGTICTSGQPDVAINL